MFRLLCATSAYLASLRTHARSRVGSVVQMHRVGRIVRVWLSGLLDGLVHTFILTYAEDVSLTEALVVIAGISILAGRAHCVFVVSFRAGPLSYGQPVVRLGTR